MKSIAVSVMRLPSAVFASTFSRNNPAGCPNGTTALNLSGSTKCNIKYPPGCNQYLQLRKNVILSSIS